MTFPGNTMSVFVHCIGFYHTYLCHYTHRCNKRWLEVTQHLLDFLCCLLLTSCKHVFIRNFLAFHLTTVVVFRLIFSHFAKYYLLLNWSNLVINTSMAFWLLLFHICSYGAETAVVRCVCGWYDTHFIPV